MAKYVLLGQEILNGTAYTSRRNESREDRVASSEVRRCTLSPVMQPVNLLFKAKVTDESSGGMRLSVCRFTAVPGWLYTSELLIDIPSLGIYRRKVVTRWVKKGDNDIGIGIAFID